MWVGLSPEKGPHLCTSLPGESSRVGGPFQLGLSERVNQMGGGGGGETHIRPTIRVKAQRALNIWQCGLKAFYV
jgi:hypothetical protein